MKKKRLVKIIAISILIIISFVGIFALVTKMQYKKYNATVNATISKIIDSVIEKYPNVDDKEIIKILNSDNLSKSNTLDKYGYNEEISYIKEVREAMNKSIKQNGIIIAVFGVLLIILYSLYITKQEKKIIKVNDYLKEINKKNYILKIEENGENPIDKLRNELYKTTVLLKETAENSEKEKTQLSNSLADISHQLKTPLTSIRIMLDNIEENPNMDEETKTDFIREISRQVDWISSLVISLLKLAKFDAGAIKMNDKKINVQKLIENVISNLSILLEIKEIEVILNSDKEATFIGDYNWQLEAVTNIVKNAVEHSKENSKIYICVENTSLFLKITIKDNGKGIDKQDLKHIFERFYKSKNSLEGSVGIGLPLAKTIIEQSNGYIRVESEINKGTTFEIKYMK